jgi:hypothetical protein
MDGGGCLDGAVSLASATVHTGTGLGGGATGFCQKSRHPVLLEVEWVAAFDQTACRMAITVTVRWKKWSLAEQFS